jgi:hypothetical protein
VLISLQHVVEKREFVKTGPVTLVCTLLEGVNKFLPVLSIFFFIKFCENVFSINRTLLMGINENFPYFLHFALDSDIIRYRKNA